MQQRLRPKGQTHSAQLLDGKQMHPQHSTFMLDFDPDYSIKSQQRSELGHEQPIPVSEMGSRPVYANGWVQSPVQELEKC